MQIFYGIIFIIILCLAYYLILKSYRNYKTYPNGDLSVKNSLRKKALLITSVILIPIVLVIFSDIIYFTFRGDYIEYWNAGADQSYYEHQEVGIAIGLLFHLATTILILKIYDNEGGENMAGLFTFIISVLSLINLLFLFITQIKVYNY